VVVLSVVGVEMVWGGLEVEEMDVDGAMAEGLEYAFWERLIPFSGVWRMMRGVDVGVVGVDWVGVMAGISREVVEARVDYVDGEIVVVEARDGWEFDEGELGRKLGEVRVVGVDDTVVRVGAERALAGEVDVDGYRERLVAVGRGVAEAFGGSEYSVVAVDMGGEWSFAVGADEVWASASTYKLYVAYSMLRKVELGEVTWESRLGGASLAECFEAMIVESDNGCPVAWLQVYGYESVDAEVKGLGLGHTQIVDDDMRTTAADLAVFLGKLYRGELVGEEFGARLIDAMKRQKYRDGVPAGVAPSVVADKVGFLWGMLHDAGIVYDERGDYVLVIMTDGGSWGDVAGMAGVVGGLRGDY
jgi:beta-lactamase class A